MQQLVTELMQSNRRAAARMISLVENDDLQKRELPKDLYPYTGNTYVIGVTGAPGSS
jgi:LAO/AO transport system kinase